MIIKEHRPDHIEIERAHRNKVGNGTFEKEGLHVADGIANSKKKKVRAEPPATTPKFHFAKHQITLGAQI